MPTPNSSIASQSIRLERVRDTERTLGEEIASSLTHGAGAVLSVAGLAAMVYKSVQFGNVWHIAAACVYGLSLVLLYLSSTLYHAITPPGLKHVFRIFDHSAIYVLIAGTYTPFVLVTMHGVWGWTLFGIVWTLAAVGIVFQARFVGRWQFLSTAVYLLMGWAGIVVMGPLLNALPQGAFLWLLAGGIGYSVGVIFYASRWKFAHAIWHLFVLVGSVSHFVAVYGYVLPGKR